MPATEQGAGFMAAGYARSSGRVGCLPRHLGPGCDQLRHADPRLPGRLDSGGAHHAARCRARRWEPTRSRRRRSSTSWRRAPSTSSCSPTRRKVEATMRTAFDIARSGRPGPVVVDIPRDVQLEPGRRSRAAGCCRCAATASASTRLDQAPSSRPPMPTRSSRCSADVRAPADLRRRRRHQQRRRARAARVRRSASAFRS